MMPAKKSCGHKNGGTVSYGLLMCVGVSRTFVKACGSSRLIVSTGKLAAAQWPLAMVLASPK